MIFVRNFSVSAPSKFHLTLASSTGANLYTVEALKAMCRWVKQFKDLDSVNNDCSVHTLAGHIASIAGVDCEDLTPEHLDSALQLLTLCSPYIYSGNFTASCLYISCPGIPEYCTSMNSVFQILTYLSDKSFTESGNLRYAHVMIPLLDSSPERALEFYDEFSRDYDSALLDLVGADAKIIAKLQTRYTYTDLIYIYISAALVVTLSYLYMHSMILAIALVLDIVFSCGLAYFFYFIIFRLAFFPTLNFAALLIVISIAADDLFLFYNIWMQHRNVEENDVATTLSLTFKHAAMSTFTTSFTTASALYVSTISNITIIKCFAVFSGTAIICDLILMVTFIPAMLILHDKASKC